MNEELQNKLLELINRGDVFLSGQLPDVIQQFLQWKIMENWLQLASVLVLIPTAYFLIKKGNQINDDRSNPVCLIFWLLGAAFCLLSLCFLMICPFELLQLYYAPKIYLLEYFRAIK